MELAPWAEAAAARNGEEEWVVMEGGIVPICPSLSVQAQGWNLGWGSLLSVGLAGWLAGRAGWNDCLGGWWGGLVCHFCYDLHGCQSQWQRDKALAELEALRCSKSHSFPSILHSSMCEWSSVYFWSFFCINKVTMYFDFYFSQQYSINSSPVNNPATLSCGWGVQALVIAQFQIQVTLPQVSAQGQHDQQYTVFILSLPVVKAVVPAGSLPSALPCQCHTFSVQKCKQSMQGQTGKHKGNTAEASQVYYCFWYLWQLRLCM